MIQLTPLFFKHLMQSWTVRVWDLLGGRTYQMEFGVPCLIGTSVPAVGCSRQTVCGFDGTKGLTWCLGEPLKEKKNS